MQTVKTASPNRTCALKREVGPQEDLLRFTLTPDNQVVPDFKKKLPGKGIYISNSKTALAEAIKKHKFGKNAKTDNNLLELVENLLKNRCLEAINLARKSGTLITGFDKVIEKLKKGKVACLLMANDAGADGRKKMENAAKGIMILNLFSIEELDKALNKVNTVHAALLKSEMANMVCNQINKWQNFINS